MENYSNVQAVVKSIANGKTDVQLKLMKHARECIKPAMKYFEDHLKAEIMSVPMKAFKAARLFSPHYVKEIKHECAPVNSLLDLPFVTSSIVSELTDEFPKYAILTNYISPDYTALAFWKDHGTIIPKWNDVAKNIVVLQPSFWDLLCKKCENFPKELWGKWKS